MNQSKTPLVASIAAILVAVIAMFTSTMHAPTQAPKPGSVSSPDIQSPYFSFGGVRQWGAHASPRSATTTVCSIQTPAATSTLESLVVTVVNNLGFTIPVQVGWAINPYATTTLLMSNTIPASNALTLNSTSSVQALTGTGSSIEGGVLQPNTYINVNISSSSVSSLFAPTGSCNAVFNDASNY